MLGYQLRLLVGSDIGSRPSDILVIKSHDITRASRRQTSRAIAQTAFGPTLLHDSSIAVSYSPSLSVDPRC